MPAEYKKIGHKEIKGKRRVLYSKGGGEQYVKTGGRMMNVERYEKKVNNNEKNNGKKNNLKTNKHRKTTGTGLVKYFSRKQSNVLSFPSNLLKLASGTYSKLGRGLTNYFRYSQKERVFIRNLKICLNVFIKQLKNHSVLQNHSDLPDWITRNIKQHHENNENNNELALLYQYFDLLQCILNIITDAYLESIKQNPVRHGYADTTYTIIKRDLIYEKSYSIIIVFSEIQNAILTHFNRLDQKLNNFEPSYNMKIDYTSPHAFAHMYVYVKYIYYILTNRESLKDYMEWKYEYEDARNEYNKIHNTLIYSGPNRDYKGTDKNLGTVSAKKITNKQYYQ